MTSDAKATSSEDTKDSSIDPIANSEITETLKENHQVKRASDSGETAIAGETDQAADLDELEQAAGGAESARSVRQLRPLGNWQYRSLDTALSRQNNFAQSSYDPFAFISASTPPSYLKSGARYYQPQAYSKKEITNNYNDYLEAYVKAKQGSQYLRPVESHKTQGGLQNYKAVTKITPQDTILPLLISNQSPRPQQYQTAFTAAAFVNNHNGKKYTTPVPDLDDETIPDNFAFFHFGNSYSSTPISVNNGKHSVKLNPQPVVQQTPQKLSQSTHRSPFIAFSSVGGFFNNQPTSSPIKETFVGVSKHPVSSQPQPSKKILAGPSTPAPVYESVGNSILPNNVRFPITTAKSPVSAVEYYPQNVYVNSKNSQPHQAFQNYNDKPVTAYEASTPKPSAYFVTKSTNGFQPIAVSTTPRYYQSVKVQPGSVEYNRFFESIKNSHIQQVDTKSNGLQDIGTHYVKNGTTNLRPVPAIPQYQTGLYYGPSSAKPTRDYQEYYYDDDEIVGNRDHKYVKNTLNGSRKPSNPKRPVEDDDEYYDDDDDDDYEYRYPVNKSKYTPMTETMAPRPLGNLTTPRPAASVSGHIFYSNHKYETTTWRPPTMTTPSPTTSDIPPIITFPEDVFQGIRPFNDIPRYLNKSTARPYTIRQRIHRPTAIPNANLIDETTSKELLRTTAKSISSKSAIKTTTQPPTTTSTTTTQTPAVTRTRTTTVTPSTGDSTSRKRYTIRPNRGQNRWRTTETPEQPTISTRPNKNQNHNNRLELDERLPNRYEYYSSTLLLFAHTFVFSWGRDVLFLI